MLIQPTDVGNEVYSFCSLKAGSGSNGLRYGYFLDGIGAVECICVDEGFRAAEDFEAHSIDAVDLINEIILYIAKGINREEGITTLRH